MPKWISVIWPLPGKISEEELKTMTHYDLNLDAKIKKLRNLDKDDPSIFMDSVQRIADDEDRRKIGAETRATTFIAAVAALIPLMTWALGNTTPTVFTTGWWSVAWSALFILSVIYFVTAAYWALQALAVANYHVIGVEDVVQIKEQGKSIARELIKQTLLASRKNRDVINNKLTCIKVAQRRFFNGLALLGFLLMLDPLSRFGIISFLQSQLTVIEEKSCNSSSKPSKSQASNIHLTPKNQK